MLDFGIISGIEAAKRKMQRAAARYLPTTDQLNAADLWRIFGNHSSGATRQQRRRMRFQQEFAWITQKWGGEPRRNRRNIAKVRFWRRSQEVS